MVENQPHYQRKVTNRASRGFTARPERAGLQSAARLLPFFMLAAALLGACAQQPGYDVVDTPPEFLSLDNNVLAVQGRHESGVAAVEIPLEKEMPALAQADELRVFQFSQTDPVPLEFRREGTALSIQMPAGATALIFAAPTGLLRDNYLVLCRLKILPPRLLPAFEDRLCPLILCASDARPAEALFERVPGLGEFRGDLQLDGLRVGGIGGGFGPGGICERCVGRPPPLYVPECMVPPEPTCSVEIADEDGTVLTSPVTQEEVAVRTELQALVTPAGLVGTTYSWTVGGSRIKDYDHDIDEPADHNPNALTAADLDDREISYFWTNDATDVEVKVDVSLPTGATCRDSEDFAVGRSSDINFDVYAEDADDDRTPGYDTLSGHGSWHFGDPVDGETPPFSNPEGYWGDTRMFSTPNTYNGSSFLDWHRALIDAHIAWRNTFNAGGFVGPDPSPGTPAKPDYFERTPPPASTDTSRVYDYVRLGEFQDVDELGRDVVHPWHNSGHGAIGSATGYTRMFGFDSPGSQEDTFWKWHTLVDEPRRDWLAGGGADQAGVVSTVPSDGATLASAPTEVVVSFDKRVSSNASSENTIQITADKLRVNGQPATTLTDAGSSTRFMVYSFSGFPAPAAGAVNVELDGTASYSGTTFSFTITP